MARRVRCTWGSWDRPPPRPVFSRTDESRGTCACRAGRDAATSTPTDVWPSRRDSPVVSMLDKDAFREPVPRAKQLRPRRSPMARRFDPCARARYAPLVDEPRYDSHGGGGPWTDRPGHGAAQRQDGQRPRLGSGAMLAAAKARRLGPESTRRLGPLRFHHASRCHAGSPLALGPVGSRRGEPLTLGPRRGGLGGGKDEACQGVPRPSWRRLVPPRISCARGPAMGRVEARGPAWQRKQRRRRRAARATLSLGGGGLRRGRGRMRGLPSATPGQRQKKRRRRELCGPRTPPCAGPPPC